MAPLPTVPADSRMEHSDSARRTRLSRWYLRVPFKLCVFAVVSLFVLFPDPWQLGRHVSRIRNLNAMIEPDAPGVAALEVEFRNLPATTSAAATAAAHSLRDVERFVLDKVQYEWDWNLWGAADYIPTIAEMFDMAANTDGRLREDCDGRAVVAASLMRRLGYDATIVTDLRHVWVVTPEGSWMGPGGAATVQSTEHGNRVAWGTLLSNVSASLSFGIAVFPFGRELIILLTAYCLMLTRGMSRTAAALGLMLLVQGLLFLRLGFLAPAAVSREASSWPAWVGIFHVAAAFYVLISAGRKARRAMAS